MISLVLPVYGNLIYTEAMLQSLKNSGMEYELIIIDNKPTTQSKKLLSGYGKVITNKVNKGASESYNQGVKEAGGDVIVLVANDQILSPNWLLRMFKVKDDNPQIGALTAYCFSFTSDEVINYAFRQRFLELKKNIKIRILSDYEDLLFELYGNWEIFTEEFWNRNGERLIDGYGQVVMLNRSLWEELDGFYTKLTYGYEDADFADRILELGYQCKVLTGVYIHHHIGMTTGKLKITPKEEERNIKLLMKRRTERG